MITSEFCYVVLMEVDDGDQRKGFEWRPTEPRVSAFCGLWPRNQNSWHYRNSIDVAVWFRRPRRLFSQEAQMIPIGRCPIRHCHRRPLSVGAGKVEHPEWGSIELDRWFTKVHIKCGRVHGCVLAHSRKEQISQRAWSSGWENNIVLDVKCNAVVFARLTKHGSIQKVGTGGRFDLCHGAFCGYRPVILHFVCGALRFHRVVSAFWGFRRWELCQFTVVVSPPPSQRAVFMG